MVEALRYKLRNVGITIDLPAGVFSDNQYVTKNSSIPNSTLNKIRNAIFYHRAREDQVDDIIWVGWI